MRRIVFFSTISALHQKSLDFLPATEVVEWFNVTEFFLEPDSKSFYTQNNVSTITVPRPKKNYPKALTKIPSSIGEVVTCPKGWQPMGPHCTTMSKVSPYTQCPTDKRRFEKGVSTVFSVSLPGVCQVAETTGLLMSCRDGYDLYFRSEGFLPKEMKPWEDMSNQWVCRKSVLKAKGEGGKCSDGGLGDSCFETEEHLPFPGCPPTFKLGGKATSRYAFHGKEYAKCRRLRLFKGNTWCPSGFDIDIQLFPNKNFGDYLSEEYQKEILEEAGLNDFPRPSCLSPIAVYADKCEKDFTCKSEEISNIKKTVEQWAWYKLEQDPRTTSYGAVPSGKDLRYTRTGVFRNFL
eukprot:GHVP01048200.1.p1 GENE.GHVP01048200.1~~GHVP01048200.1.p1  ORF type:complete len:348 (-),score=54.66 GHVP01048200.1:37-1080(-)